MVTKRFAMLSLVAVLFGACADGGASALDTSTERVDLRGWAAIDYGAFSPDGKIAFIGWDDEDNPRVGVADGAKPVPVNPPGTEPTDFAWMPDGNTLLISDRSQDDSGDRLAVYDLHGKRLRTIPATLRFQAGQGMVVRKDGEVAVIAVSEPGQFDTYTELVEVDLLTGATRNLTNTPEVAEDWPVYTHDGQLLFRGGVLLSDAEGPNGWIGVLDLASGRVQRMSPPEQAAGRPAVVFGGSVVLYDAFPPPERREQALWLVPLAGGEARRLQLVNGSLPAAHPNGDKVLVAEVGVPGSPGGLRVIPLASLKPSTPG